MKGVEEELGKEEDVSGRALPGPLVPLFGDEEAAAVSADFTV